LQIEPKNLKNYASGFIVLFALGLFSSLAFAAPGQLRSLTFVTAASSIA
jgi:hypothetical protein